MPEVRMTIATGLVLAAFLDDPAADRYGLDLMRVTGHPSGTLYPILVRLERAGWIEARWEEIDPVEAGRPARRYYRLTPDGLAAAESELATLRARLAPKAGPAPKAAEPKPARRRAPKVRPA